MSGMYKISYMATRMMAEATRGDPGKIPPLGVFGDIPVQLRSVVGHAPHQAADVVRLLGVGRLLIQRVLLRQAAKDSGVRRSSSSSSTGLSVKLSS